MWLGATLVVHDAVLVPVVMTVGAVLSTVVPRRVRLPLQWFLVSGALVTVIALPQIYRRGSQTPSKTLLTQDYGGHLLLILGLLAVVAVTYALAVLRRRALPESERRLRR